MMFKMIHVLALVASLFDHSHTHVSHDEHALDIIFRHINSRRAIARS